MEEWRDIPGYEGVYRISDQGRIMRIKSGPGARPGLILKPYVRPDGYHNITLWSDNVSHKYYIHRLVLVAFLGPPPPNHEVNHKDGCKSNNCLDNLEWMERSANMFHRHRVLGQIGPQGERCGKAKLTADQVREIRRLYGTGNYQQKDLADAFHVSRTAIQQIVNYQRWKHI